MGIASTYSTTIWITNFLNYLLGKLHISVSLRFVPSFERYYSVIPYCLILYAYLNKLHKIAISDLKKWPYVEAVSG